jgi:hypothetical protein
MDPRDPDPYIWRYMVEVGRAPVVMWDLGYGWMKRRGGRRDEGRERRVGGRDEGRKKRRVGGRDEGREDGEGGKRVTGKKESKKKDEK